MKNPFSNLQYFLLASQALALSLCGLTSCQNEKSELVAPATTYLKFSDITSLNSAIKEISKSASADKQSSIRKAIQTYAVNGMSSNFQSLLNHPEKKYERFNEECY